MPRMFTSRHYVKTADVIAALPFERSDRYVIALRFAEMFAADNPRFARPTFLRACGLADG